MASGKSNVADARAWVLGEAGVEISFVRQYAGVILAEREPRTFDYARLPYPG